MMVTECPLLEGKADPSLDVGGCSFMDGGLNRSAQHFILNGKDGVSGDQSKISSRFHCGRENGVVGSLEARRVAEGDWTSFW